MAHYHDDRNEGRDVAQLRHPYIFPTIAGTAAVLVLIMALLESTLR